MEDDEEMNEEDEELYEADFEIGHFLKEFLIPKAVLYYTGELIDEANYDDEEEYDEDDGVRPDAYLSFFNWKNKKNFFRQTKEKNRLRNLIGSLKKYNKFKIVI